MNFPKENLRRILFLDIETATEVSSFDQLEPKLKELWRKRSNRQIDARAFPLTEKDISDYFLEKAAIFAEYSRVVCITVGFLENDNEDSPFRVKSFANEDELTVLTEFSEILNKYFYDRYHHYLCGHNIKEFDIPFLCRRYLINSLKLPNLLNITGQKPWQVNHLLDTMEMWKFGDYKHYSSLDILCAVLGVDSPKLEMTGKDVNKAFWDGRLNEISHYCEKDLIATAQVYLRCNGIRSINSDKIVHVSNKDVQ